MVQELREVRPIGPLRLRPLPAPPTPLIGRQHDVDEIRRHLLRSHVRLVTLTGPAGAGKTRLALHVATELRDSSPHRVCFVNLDQVVDPSLVVSTIAQSLGIAELRERSLFEALRQAIEDEELLLVLDNFEQVLGAAPDVAELLSSCSKLKVLATSRAPLRLRWEHEYPVPPFALPEPDHGEAMDVFAANPAVALFVERSRAVQPDFALDDHNAAAVAAICRRLDGLPLAIELAAARTKVFTPQALLARLQRGPDLLSVSWGDAAPRQQSLRGAIAWSYRLLDAANQSLFLRLAVFRGGCTPEAVAAVCFQPGESIQGDGEALERVASLVDNSLLQRVSLPDGTARFHMLDTIREYALERLVESGELQGVRALHAAYFLGLAESVPQDCEKPRQQESYDLLDRDLENVRVALDWYAESADRAGDLLRLAAALGHFWLRRGYLSEGRQRIEAALATVEAAGVGDTPARARALFTAGKLAEHRGDYPAACAYFADCIPLCRRLGVRDVLASALVWTACVCANAGLDTSRLLAESLAIYEELNDQMGMAKVFNSMGERARVAGDYEGAEEQYERSLALYKAAGNEIETATMFHNLGYVAQHFADHRRATALFSEGIALYSRDGHHQKRHLAVCLAALAGVALLEQPERAARTFGAAEAHLDAIGSAMQPADRMEHDRNVERFRSLLGEETFRKAWSEGRRMTLEEAIGQVQQSLAGATRPTAGATSTATPPALTLSAREREVVVLIARGLTNRQIAERLVIAPRTADTHVANILNKLGFTTRAHVAAWAVEQGFLAENRHQSR